MPARVTPDVWKQLIRRPPFIGVGWPGFHTGNGSMSELNGNSTWNVHLVTVNQRGPAARYFGDDAAPGLFDLVCAGTAILHGYTIPGGGTIQVAQADCTYVEGYNDPNLAMATIELMVRTSIPLSSAIGDVTVQALTATTVAWSFNGGAGTALTEQTTGGV